VGADRARGPALADGVVGEPRLATLVQYVPLVADPDARVPEWWFDDTRGGGWLGASGSHIVDQVRTWFGEIASVSATLPTVARGAGAEDSFVVRLTTASGVEAVLQQTAASWTAGVAGLTVVAGTDGTLEVGGDGVGLGPLRSAPAPCRRSRPSGRRRAIRVTGIRTSSSVLRLCEALRPVWTTAPLRRWYRCDVRRWAVHARARRDLRRRIAAPSTSALVATRRRTPRCVCAANGRSVPELRAG
jgi:hypothetical protein